MKKFRFLTWNVYGDAQELFSFVLQIVKKTPREFRYELGSQIIRSAFSVILNIAEGSGKSSDKEMNRFLEIALGSLYETLAAADTFRNNNFMTEEEFDIITNKIDNITNQLGGLKKKLDCNQK